MKASDLAYLAALVEGDRRRKEPRSYDRREQLLNELQSAYHAASSLKTKRYTIKVLTSWGEEERGLKENDKTDDL